MNTNQQENPVLESISNNDACYAYNLVKTICLEVGPGLPGSSQEWVRANVVKQELQSVSAKEGKMAVMCQARWIISQAAHFQWHFVDSG